MQSRRLHGAGVMVLAVLCLILAGQAQAHGLVVSYRGAQDKYVPCIFLADGLNDLAPSDVQASLGCIGHNIVARVKTTHSQDFSQLLKAPAPDDRYGVLMVALDNGVEQRRHFYRTSDAIPLLRRILADFPQIREDVESRFVQRLLPVQQAIGQLPPTGAGSPDETHVERHSTLSQRQIDELTHQSMQGSAKAAQTLAEYYSAGSFYPDTEIYWWSVAARNGSPQGQYRYARILAGMRGQSNLREAISWMKKARAAHVKGADEALQVYELKLQAMSH